MIAQARDAAAGGVALLVGRGRSPAGVVALEAPLVSVIVPAFEAAEVLDGALESVARQSLARWEALIVDDGSTDGTLAVAEAWAARDRRFRVLRLARNRGVGAARNAGLAAAQGRYVLFLDADDWIGADHLRTLADAMAASPDAVAAYGGTTPIGIDGAEAPPELPPPPGELFAHSARACPLAIHACLARRDVIDRLGGFDTGLAVGEDWDLWQRLARTGAPQIRVPCCSAYYRARPGSARRSRPSALRDCLELVRRGHATDPRVPGAAPEHAAGRPASELPLAATRVLIWGLGLVAGAGCDPRRALAELPPIPLTAMAPAEAAVALLHGLATGRGTATARLAGDWDALWSAVRPSLDLLATRLGDPGLALRIGERAERSLAETGAPECQVGGVVARRLDLAEPWPEIALPPEARVLRVRAELAGRPLGDVELPVAPGTDAGPALARALLEQLGARWMKAWARHSVRHRPAAAARLARKLLTNPEARRILPKLARSPIREMPWRLAAWLAQHPQLALPPTLRVPSPAAGDASPVTPAPPVETWDAVFAEPDPWRYDSAYERAKYAHSLELLPAGRIGRALELACAEGHFTRLLAQHVEELIATDISAVALERARRRCAADGNIIWRRLDLRRDPLPSGLDLVVCSEVLYFLRDRLELARVGRRLAAHLAPGGHLLTAHAKLLADEPGGTGFDWDLGLGARRIGATFARLGRLELVRELETDLYLVQLFRRRRSRLAPRCRPERLRREAVPPEVPEVRAAIAGPGARTGQVELLGRLRTDALPILMYHRIATDGPPALAPYRLHPDRLRAQLAWLKAEGYRGVGLGVWQWALRERLGALPGKAVALTFDDAYRDFAELAWPLLRAHGFGATLFVVADHAGGHAAWDAELGDPAPLLGWDELRRLAREGVEIGAHGASHAHLARLSAAEVVAEATRARARIEAEIGRPVTLLAYPHGDSDGLVRRACAAAGFELAVTSRPGLARLGDDPMGLPRQEVRGDATLESFAAKLGSPREVGWGLRLRHRLDRRLARGPRW
jgi:peptidoglycan/xylan/chitin deacetylase (PgdA/CDA1 family)